MPPTDDRQIDWSLTTWEGSEREQLRRWSKLSLEEILRAQEEMQSLAQKLAGLEPSARGAGAAAKKLILRNSRLFKRLA